MDMAKMTGCQPDLRTSLTGAEPQAMMTHTGRRSSRRQHTTGGRYHMSAGQYRTQDKSVSIFLMKETNRERVKQK